MRTPEQLKTIHDERQRLVPLNKICIRQGVVLSITDDSRFPFEFFCWRSPECELEMNAFVKYAQGRKKMFDIGAHHGLFSLIFSSINDGAKSLAFEPSTEPFRHLTENLMLNVSLNIAASNTAITDKDGEMKMSTEWDHFIENEAGQYVVMCSKGDIVFEKHKDVDTLKIDVEGQELKVFRGLKKCIEQNHPMIFLEIHYGRLTHEEIIELIKIIDFNGYVVIDTETDEVISSNDLINLKQGEKRIILK